LRLISTFPSFWTVGLALWAMPGTAQSAGPTKSGSYGRLLTTCRRISGRGAVCRHPQASASDTSTKTGSSQKRMGSKDPRSKLRGIETGYPGAGVADPGPASPRPATTKPKQASGNWTQRDQRARLRDSRAAELGVERGLTRLRTPRGSQITWRKPGRVRDGNDRGRS
jgi:hypothetical protein